MCGDDQKKFISIIETTYQEAQRRWMDFKEYHDEAVLPSFLVRKTQLAELQQSCLTNYVSAPIQRYFQRDGAEYLSYIKANHDPGDGWILWAQKGAWNASVDVITRYAHLAISPVTTFLRDVARKIPFETFDRLNPAHLLVLSTGSPLVRRYFAQRVDQLTTPIQYWKDFRGSFQRQIISTRGALTNAREHLSALDTGFMSKTAHLGRVVVDLTEQIIAGKIGVALALFGLFRVPSVRAKTLSSFEAMFPPGTMHGIVGRQLPVRFMISKPLARVRGNPLLSFAVVTYLITMSVARTISDSIKLQAQYPYIYERLASYNREVVNAPFHLNFRDTVKALSKKK